MYVVVLATSAQIPLRGRVSAIGGAVGSLAVRHCELCLGGRGIKRDFSEEELAELT